MHVAFCCNSAYLDCTTVAIYSLLSHAKSHVTVNLIVHDVQNSAIEAIQSLVDGANASLKVIHVSNFDQHNWKKSAYWNEANYLRLMIPNLIQEDKVLYLDSDLIVTRDLSELYETPFDGAWVVGALEYPHLAAKYQIPIKPGEPIINTGVMLMNLDALRQVSFFEKCIEIHHQYKAQIVWMDQCVINKCTEGRKKIVSNQWNQLIHAHLFNRASFASTISGKNAILHFSGPIKPWMGWSNSYITEFWLGYAKKSPLNEVRIQEISSVPEALYKIFKLDEDRDFEASGQIKNRLINSMTKSELANLGPLSDKTSLVRNGFAEQLAGDTRPTASELINALFNQS